MNSTNMLEFKGISKSFTGVRALQDISFGIPKGHVHALLGENGAGKSTLMKILSGAYTKDSGEILIDGRTTDIRNTTDSEKLGVAIIYQELNLIPELTIAENIFLDRQPINRGLIDWKRMRADAQEALQQIDIELDVKMKVGSLSVAQQQMVEIAKAISLKSRILILDEPTSALTESETEKLFSVIRRLRSQGITMIYISHRMEEIFEICDSYTVMRDGTYVTGGAISEVTANKIIEYMAGRSLSQVYPETEHETGEEVLRAEHMDNGKEVKDVSFTLKKGEILGFAGLVGAGRTETLKAVFGADKKAGGKVYINGKECRIRSPREAIRHGIGFLPENRKEEGLVTDLSVMDNIVMAKMENAFENGRFSVKKASKLCASYIKSLLIKTPSEKQKVKFLSGGNQQKVVLAKWLNCDPDIIVLDEPTRGIDVNAKFEIYQIIVSLAAQGKSIIFTDVFRTAQRRGRTGAKRHCGLRNRRHQHHRRKRKDMGHIFRCSDYGHYYKRNESAHPVILS